MTPHQNVFSSKCVYFETLNVNKHYIGMEPNSEAFEGPTASNLIGWEHRFEQKKVCSAKKKFFGIGASCIGKNDF